MKYVLGKQTINIPDKDIEKSMRVLGISKEEAIQMWLEDEEYLENDEQEELCQKAKDNRVTATIHEAGHREKRKQTKPRVIKVSDEKATLFSQILSNLEYDYKEVEVLKENKLIQVKIGEKIFKIDLIEQRPSKK